MKKLVLLIVGIIVLIFAVRVFWMFENANAGVHIVDTNPNNLKTRTYKKACDIFSLNDAREILGQSVVEGENVKSSVISGGRAQTSCEYRISADSSSGDRVIAIGLYDADSTSTRSLFEQAQGKDPQVLVGIGQKAFWVSKENKLHVLKGQYWASVSYKEGSKRVTYELPQSIMTRILENL